MTWSRGGRAAGVDKTVRTVSRGRVQVRTGSHSLRRHRASELVGGRARGRRRGDGDEEGRGGRARSRAQDRRDNAVAFCSLQCSSFATRAGWQREDDDNLAQQRPPSSPRLALFTLASMAQECSHTIGRLFAATTAQAADPPAPPPTSAPLPATARPPPDAAKRLRNTIAGQAGMPKAIQVDGRTGQARKKRATVSRVPRCRLLAPPHPRVRFLAY